MERTLSEIQIDFSQSILKNKNFDEKNNPTQMQDDTVNLYQEGVFSRLIILLSRVYSVTHHFLGEELFGLIAHQFVQQYPSTETNILDYGKYFSDFIVFNHFEKNHHFLPCLTRFEWAWHCCFHGYNNSSPDLNQLFSTIEEKQENSRLHLPHHAQLIRTHFPVANLWFAHQQEKPYPPLLPDPAYYMLWQESEKVKIETLTKEEYLLLKLIEKNKNLEEVCFFYQTFSTEIEMDSFFSSLCQKGCISIS